MAIGGLYPIYLEIITGNPFEFIIVQSMYWHRLTTWPWITIMIDVERFSHLYYSYQSQIILGFMGLYICLVLAFNYWTEEKVLVLFLILGSVGPLISAEMHPGTAASTSYFRYVYSLFPLYLLGSRFWKTGWNAVVKFIVVLILNFWITVLFRPFGFDGGNFNFYFQLG